MDAMRALDRSFAREDGDHLLAIKNAAAAGATNPPDARTGQPEREAAMEGKLERISAEVELLADVVTEAESLLRELEPVIVGALSERAKRADAERAELLTRAQQLNREAITYERAAEWLFRTVDGSGGPLVSVQAFPTVPAESIDVTRVSRRPEAFERHWTAAQEMETRSWALTLCTAPVAPVASTNKKVRAAARLLDGLVELADDGRPIALDQTIGQASTDYGSAAFAPRPALPALDLHQGARVSAPVDEDASIAAHMRATGLRHDAGLGSVKADRRQ